MLIGCSLWIWFWFILWTFLGGPAAKATAPVTFRSVDRWLWLAAAEQTRIMGILMHFRENINQHYLQREIAGMKLSRDTRVQQTPEDLLRHLLQNLDRKWEGQKLQGKPRARVNKSAFEFREREHMRTPNPYKPMTSGLDSLCSQQIEVPFVGEL